MIESFFTQEHIDSIRPHIQETVDHLLDTVVKNGSEKPIDLVERFSLPVPSYVSPPTVIEDIMATSNLLHYSKYHFNRSFMECLECHSTTLST